MLQGKISGALKFINNDADAATGVLSINNETIEALEGKHPDPGLVNEEFLCCLMSPM